MQDAWRAYLELALGLTEASRRKAERAAKDLLDKGGATAVQVQTMVEDLVSTSRANREELAKLVRYEVDRALGAVGLANADEVSQLTTRIQELERRLREQEARAGAGEPPARAATKTPVPVVEAGPPQPVGASKTVAKKATAKKAVAKQTAAKQSPAKETTAKKTAKKTTKKTIG